MSESDNPINRELFREFKTAAHGVFITALNNGLPQGYEGKRLTDLLFTAHRSFEKTVFFGAMDVEQLELCTINPAAVGGDLPGEWNQALAVKMSSTMLHKDLDFQALIPIDAVAGGYCAHFNDDNIEAVTLYGHMEELDARVLVSARDFALESLAKNTANKHAASDFEQELTFSIGWDLPLNGREGITFLRRYHKKMSDKAYELLLRVASLENTGGPEVLLAPHREMMRKYEAAARNASSFLGNH